MIAKCLVENEWVVERGMTVMIDSCMDFAEVAVNKVLLFSVAPVRMTDGWDLVTTSQVAVANMSA
jgi:hypothetical protein